MKTGIDLKAAPTEKHSKISQIEAWNIVSGNNDRQIYASK